MREDEATSQRANRSYLSIVGWQGGGPAGNDREGMAYLQKIYLLIYFSQML